MSTETLLIEDIGCASSLKIPNGWIEAPHSEHNGFAGREIRCFHPVGIPEVRFISYVRTVTLSAPAQEQFEKTLYSEFHRVLPDELHSLSSVLEALSNQSSFEIKAASTGYVSGKRALRVEGVWKMSGEQMLSFFFDQRGDAKLVQELCFIAPDSEFKKNLQFADSIFESIVWKKSS
jgi:hypothetical protein